MYCRTCKLKKNVTKPWCGVQMSKYPRMLEESTGPGVSDAVSLAARGFPGRESGEDTAL